MGGGGKTTVKSIQEPPQLPKESSEGFQAAQGFYKGQIARPSVFPGQRLAPPSPTQTEAIGQGKKIFGRPSDVQQASSQQLIDTLTGSYLEGPGAAAAVGSLAAPIFQRYRTEVFPQIRDVSQATGQGVTGDRRVIAENEAIERFGREVAQGAIAPIFEGERTRQLQATAQAPKDLMSEILRITQLGSTGAQERAFAQEPLDVERQKFEEPIFRQSGSADALLGSANFGPGSSQSTAREHLTAAQEISQWVSILASVAGIVAASTRSVKTDIKSVDRSLSDDIVTTMLNAPVTTWRYKWDHPSQSHIGPMLEDLPQILENSATDLDIVSYLGALLLTIQKQNERITKLENQLSSNRE